MQIFRHRDLDRDFKSLKRCLTPEESLASWERLFSLKGIKETPGIDAFPGFGSHRIYKGRVVPLKENIGKSGGYRVIFEMRSEVEYEVLVFSRHGIYKSEQELIDIIKSRLNI
ncbi:MAG: hypothetical protein A2541_02535 [Candidatus Taylorbacteria bacterium RIFOXYD2_FULL_36_9]|uniref:Addiction module toxin RelE n=1 Tax=Candidatus Taylorbacteria bacterium RIFOXYD2_FULL_36_9 TaxID=1802338 RepID=A0A1G2PD59_9BACT|nr:MAG: hypothetical protein A2541_02535 [Candidatus Taylorbacteria bacterium RIFOXYD2_FULL_36_9]